MEDGRKTERRVECSAGGGVKMVERRSDYLCSSDEKASVSGGVFGRFCLRLRTHAEEKARRFCMHERSNRRGCRAGVSGHLRSASFAVLFSRISLYGVVKTRGWIWIGDVARAAPPRSASSLYARAHNMFAAHNAIASAITAASTRSDGIAVFAWAVARSSIRTAYSERRRCGICSLFYSYICLSAMCSFRGRRWSPSSAAVLLTLSVKGG